MISVGTGLHSGDNTGIRYAKCIRVLGGFSKRYAKLSNLVVVAIKKLDFKKHLKKKINKKKKYLALLINVKKKTKRVDGTFLSFKKNTALFLTNKQVFLGTRVYTPICKEIRLGKQKHTYKKIISYSLFTV